MKINNLSNDLIKQKHDLEIYNNELRSLKVFFSQLRLFRYKFFMVYILFKSLVSKNMKINSPQVASSLSSSPSSMSTSNLPGLNLTDDDDISR